MFLPPHCLQAPVLAVRLPLPSSFICEIYTKLSSWWSAMKVGLLIVTERLGLGLVNSGGEYSLLPVASVYDNLCPGL